ncbi:hypothetical protein HN451_01525 [archaeon]|nr:hypothetical protein [archaeon]
MDTNKKKISKNKSNIKSTKKINIKKKSAKKTNINRKTTNKISINKKSNKKPKNNKKSNQKGGKIPSPMGNPFVNSSSPNVMRLNNYICLRENTVKDLSNVVYELFSRRINEGGLVEDASRAGDLKLPNVYRNTQRYKDDNALQHALFNQVSSLA